MTDAMSEAAYHRLTGRVGAPDLTAAASAVSAVASRGGPAADTAALLDALVLLRWTQARLAALEPALVTTARAAGVSWQALAPALGVASRQAAERRYLRLAPRGTTPPGATRDDRVRAERDRRAGHRAVARWANDNTAELRRLAGQITALSDLDAAAADDVDRLHRALADPDATALPSLLADAHRHLADHPELAGQVDTVTAHTELVRQETQQRRDGAH